MTHADLKHLELKGCLGEGTSCDSVSGAQEAMGIDVVVAPDDSLDLREAMDQGLHSLPV